MTRAGQISTPFLSMPFLMGAVVSIAWFCAVPAPDVYAQSQPPGPSEQTPKVPDQKLDATAAAIKQLTSVREDYEQRIEAAAPPDRERIAEEAKAALTKAITDQGLSLPEYTTILTAARNDREVQQKIIERLERSDK